MTAIKICGITNKEDALFAAKLGVNALGFIFAPSPRKVTPFQAREIIDSLPPLINKVGVFLNQSREEVAQIALQCGLDTIQLHGDETPEYCNYFGAKVIKSFRVKDKNSLIDVGLYKVSAFLLDTYVSGQPGGTGKTFNWELAELAQKSGPIIIAGGLTPDNVNEAIGQVRPYGVDIGSGVELSPGKKDLNKLVKLVKRIRGEGNEFTR